MGGEQEGNSAARGSASFVQVALMFTPGYGTYYDDIFVNKALPEQTSALEVQQSTPQLLLRSI